MCHDNPEVFRVKKFPEKILEQLCAEKKSITLNNKELFQRFKYSKEIKTAKDKIQSRIDSPSRKLEITQCQANEVYVVL